MATVSTLLCVGCCCWEAEGAADDAILGELFLFLTSGEESEVRGMDSFVSSAMECEDGNTLELLQQAQHINKFSRAP